MNAQTIVLSINIALAVAVSLAAARRARLPGGRSIIAMASFTALWALCELLLHTPEFLPLRRVLIAGIFLGSMLAASSQLVYVVRHANRQSWVTRPPVTLLGVMPVLTQILFWIPSLREALFGALQSASGTGLFLDSLWGKVIATYIFSLMGIGTFLLWNAFLERHRSIFVAYGAVLVGSLFPLTAATLEFAGWAPLASAELLPLGFTAAILAYTFHFFQSRPDTSTSIDRSAVVEGMDDGWMVLDNKNIVVDMNSAAERMAGLSREQMVGKPVSNMLGSLPELGQSFNHSQELEMKRSIRSEDGWKYLNIRISPLTDRARKPFGRLALWHDVTERKLTEDARQRARDEMLVLLNAISSAASNVLDLDDFLSESIYHIIYPFRSQIVGFFLLDEKSDKKADPRFVLTAHLGLPPESAEQLKSVLTSAPLFASMLAERAPLQIEDVDSDGRVPAALQGMALACLLFLPLVTQAGDQEQLLGCMCLGRKEKPVFSTDELVRLTMISDQIAALIDSDRRRKLAITSSERKRLMRDLHDSVSQKLYGLVTTTEAAQAAIEAGSLVNPSEVLTRIGENARQAVKEMRLFLFQMQPIDMEKDGFISLLHHRLAAVEGRADIKAKFRADLTDDEIALSKQTEVVLYYIAQEALNNVLRHANASSVSVTLKQGRRNVILEIVDDGCGFDPKKVERGGLGLTSMRERVAQIHGKIQILSRPEKGTKVVITVPRDISAKPARHRR